MIVLQTGRSFAERYAEHIKYGKHILDYQRGTKEETMEVIKVRIKAIILKFTKSFIFIKLTEQLNA
jgi:hypothetical protein